MAKKPSREELEQGLNELGRKLTESERKDEKIRRLNLVLRTIRNVNQLLVKEKDSGKLLRGVCENLVANRG